MNDEQIKILQEMKAKGLEMHCMNDIHRDPVGLSIRDVVKLGFYPRCSEYDTLYWTVQDLLDTIKTDE